MFRRSFAVDRPPRPRYEDWIKDYDNLTRADVQMIRTDIDGLPAKPLISVVMPVYNTPITVLRQTIDSVIAQLYGNWELCMANDASPRGDVQEELRKFADQDRRIKVFARPERGGIATASNDALNMATGEWIAFLDHDDLLAPHALYLAAVEINTHPDAAMIFSDEDAFDDTGRRFNHYFKSDWNPDLMLGQNATGHLSLYRAKLIRSVGGLRQGVDGSQDWDLALRVSECLRPEQIRHIPHILYHWRQPTTRRTFSQQNAAETSRAALAVLNALIERRGIRGTVHPTGISSWAHVRRAPPNPSPLVTIIISTRDRVELLRQCVESILARTDYPKFEILIVNNRSSEPATLSYLREVVRDSRIRTIDDNGEFNFSSIHNAAVERAAGEVVVLLNNDTTVISRHWLTEMVGHATRAEVGAVGAMLYYPNNIIQHAGVTLGVGGVAGHSHRFFQRGAHGYGGRAMLTQNVSAVTGACLAMRKSIYRDVGGMNPQLRVAFNDIDLCLRIREAGYWIVWTPLAELYHHESATRGLPATEGGRREFSEEVLLMRRLWATVLDSDPFYNPNLTLDREDFSLAFPARAATPWTTARSVDQGTSNGAPMDPIARFK